MNTLKATSSFLLILSIILLIPSCAVNPVSGKKQLMLMSEAQEVALGAQYDPTVVSTFGNYDHPELLDFITVKGTEMGKISHRPNLKYHFKILDTPVINAFAVPGGYIYLTRGILAQFNNEAELVGVLGHEMGHITARHTASQQSKQQLGQLLMVGGMIASEDFREFAGYAMQGMQLLFLKFSRDNEREADRLGVEYSSKISYDAHKMADFFNVLKKMQMESAQAGVPTFLTTHPDPGDRYYAVNQKSDEWQKQLNYEKWTVNRDNYLKMIDGIVYGEDPRQGFTEGNVFYHPDLKFKFPYPQGWQLVNSPMQVQIAPEDGKAIMLFSLSRQGSLQEAAEKTLSDLGATVLNAEETNVNGFPALTTISQQVSQNQQTGEQQVIKVLSYFIEFENNIYVFHGVAGAADFDANIRLFESTMVNFSKLTSPSKLNVKPKRISVKTVQRNGTVADAFNDYNVPQNQMNDLALLNNMELNDPIKKGELIKIIGN